MSPYKFSDDFQVRLVLDWEEMFPLGINTRGNYLSVHGPDAILSFVIDNKLLIEMPYPGHLSKLLLACIELASETHLVKYRKHLEHLQSQVSLDPRQLEATRAKLSELTGVT